MFRGVSEIEMYRRVQFLCHYHRHVCVFRMTHLQSKMTRREPPTIHFGGTLVGSLPIGVDESYYPGRLDCVIISVLHSSKGCLL